MKGALRREDIRYLAMEGGGGKGHAYLGAVRALEDLHVMPQVRGFAGASAGAITALMLSTGMDSEQIATYMGATDFDAFFDPPEPRMRPVADTPGVAVYPEWTTKEKAVRTALSAAGTPLRLLLMAVLAVAAPKDLLDLESKRDKQPFKILAENWPVYLAFLGRDMGLFSGMAARRAWETLLVTRMRGVGHRPKSASVTFREHRKAFGKELLMTGSNLSTGRTELFSAKYTPDFPVSDAVRISMSLPFIYKPYVVQDMRRDWPPCGTYVDGGLWNNLPFREFDSRPEPLSPPDMASAAVPAGPPRPRTLALRLSIDPPVRVRDLGGLLGRLTQLGLFGTGESQVLAPYANRTIVLETEGLDLVNFTPPRAERERAVRRAYRAVHHYFSVELKPEDEDLADDLLIEKNREASRACP
ncbi:patatin-like phospholipase family protein [Streptomyces sp. BH-SS-21]|uniref:Patatin-like phospholipase family protein n=1 Tax=Streptomyces liliiviolaceus TaxID=2823109 RepID=A0A941B7Y5_9ACTN|nr:patatin-like phospholipase family protein [Streptomyces liliiviolaceus]MBQ0850332.1 patatin-like phospholipase family protein [Streptomyces liliiviolaceus]